MTHQDGPLGHLQDALEELDRQGLRRGARPGVADDFSFCSNDYLGLGARRSTGRTGSGASRLIAGERDEHQVLEHALARWLRVESTLLFSSGYAANVGTLSALAQPGDLIVSDALNHASLIDGARLSRARVVVTPHNDLDAVAEALAARTEARAWVVVESYFSMDADGPDLAALRSLTTRHGAALYIDEAHAVGVLGPDGRGLCAAAGVVPDVLVGTLGKALGGQGAFAAGRTLLREWLWNRARSFVFSTGLAPMVAAAASEALDEILRTPSLRSSVDRQSRRLRAGLTDLGLEVLGFGHVVPVRVGATDAAVALSRRLGDAGLRVPPIRPPTVPAGTARLRLTVTARHRDEDIDRVIRAFATALAEEPR